MKKWVGSSCWGVSLVAVLLALPACSDDEGACKRCEAGALCIAETGQCASFCEAPPIPPGSGTSPEEISCRALSNDPGDDVALSFDEVCQRRCRIACQRFDAFCGYACPQGICDGPEVRAQCLTDCPGTSGGGDLACLMDSCEDLKLARCTSNMACPNGAEVSCRQVTCSNDCIYPNDGRCDDGDVFASDSNDCAWGSDCADCGPRKGRRPPNGLGSICLYHSNCLRGTTMPSTADAWCVASETLPGISRCAPDCSRGQGCAAGFVCRKVLVTNSDGAKEPIVEGDLESRACFPIMCT